LLANALEAPMRAAFPALFIVTGLVFLPIACSKSESESGAGADLDWFTSSCAELGGLKTAAGACFVACKTDGDCPIDTLTCPKGSSTWVSGQCEPKDTSRGCGPDGWHTEAWGCYLACSGEGRDAECPPDFSCVADSISPGTFFCTGQPGSGGGTCGEPCADGCCSPSGFSCCAPPFCAGDCIGSPCC
jgi:hypothetical protein